MAVIAVLTNLPDSESAFNLARHPRAPARGRLRATSSPPRPPSTAGKAARNRPPKSPCSSSPPRERYPDLEREIRALHPYDLPEIIAFPVELGLENYLGWVEDECKPASEPPP